LVLGVIALVVSINITDKTEEGASVEQINYSTYENKEAGFAVDYPSSWQFSKGEDNLTYFRKSTSTESIQPTIMVGIFAHNKNLEEASKETEEIGKSIEINKENLEINGFPAIKYTFNVNIQDMPGKVTRVLIKEGDEVYGFDYSNSVEMFDTDLPVVTRMIQSFRNN